LGGCRRHAWLAGLLTLFSGFFTRFWGATDTFSPYALIGSLCLLFLGSGACASPDSNRPRILCFFPAGIMAGLAHLTRADGVLLLFVGWLVALWLWNKLPLHQRLLSIPIMTLGYLLIMTPWFVRNLGVIGSPLPVGGTQSIWFTEYDDLFNYPPDANPGTFFANGNNTLLASR
jgi:hypothetical protein